MELSVQLLSVVISILAGAFTIVAAIIALFLWARSEANADRRDIVNLIIEMKEEMKDFHHRLCEIERNKK